MDIPQIQKQVIPNEALRLPDLALMAGPREIEFEIELPKGSKWNFEGENSLAVESSAPTVVFPGKATFGPDSMRFMVPVSALDNGEAALTYGVCVSWIDKSGVEASERRQVVQRVIVEQARGATVPWVHYKARAR